MAKNVHKFQQPVKVGVLSSAPTAEQATIYYDSTIDALRVHDGSGFDTLADLPKLASTSTGDGAALIGIEDSAGDFTATDVEAALAELHTLASAGGTSEFDDSLFRVQDNGDATKQIALEASGITTATTRTITMPDTDVDLGDMAKESVLSATTNGNGASTIGIEDSGSIITATTVEGALAEIQGDLDTAESTLSTHLNGGTSKHDATEVDYERGDGSKKNIQAASDDLEASTTDLDDAIGALDATPTNYTPTDAGIVADHLAAIDGQLAAAGGSEFGDDIFRVTGSSDATKKIALEADGLTTATTRTITMPDVDVDLADIATNTTHTTGDGSDHQDVADHTTLSGVAANSTDLGTFTGTTIPDAQTNKAAMQALETAVETKANSSVVTEIDANVDDLITLSGVAENATDLGTFTGATISDSQTNKAALQDLETAHEEVDVNVNDLVTLSGVAENATDLGTFTGTTIPDSSTNKAAMQSLETAVETATSITDNFEWQNSALDLVADNTIVPATEVSGDRYVLSAAGGAPHANWDGASAGDIVEFNGTTWDATSPTLGMMISIDDETTSLRQWSGSAWVQKFFESTTASTGLTKVGFDVRMADAAASNGIAVSSGAISAQVDDSTTEISSNQIIVKDGGITNAKVNASAAINFSKMEDLTASRALVSDGSGDVSVSAVTSATLAFLDATSSVQTQLDAKLENVSEDSTPSLGGDLDLSSQALLGDLRLADSGTPTRYYEWDYIDSTTLTASTTAVAAAFTFDSKTTKAREIEYTIVSGNDRRVGTLRVVANNASAVAANDVSLVDEMNEIGDPGVTWAAALNGDNVELSYTTTAVAKTMRATVKSFLA